MPVLNQSNEMYAEVAAWRRYLHEHPELLYDVFETSKFVEAKLKEFGCDSVDYGLGKTGVVGVIKGKAGDGPVIGLRADMDALPIMEAGPVEWASKTPGKMHACGHDGHTAMLLGAAKYLSQTRNFKGSVALIFQPAEEGGGGGLAMIEDGLMDKFAIEEVYGMHNSPGLPVGHFAIRKGPVMAAADHFEVTITGKGGHASTPHLGVDPVVIAAQIITSVQNIVARETDPLESLVVSITAIHGGEAHNVIPADVTMKGTVRTLLPEIRDMAEKRFIEIVEGTAKLLGGSAKVDYHRGYPITRNHDEQTDFVTTVAQSVSGDAAVDTSPPPVMGAEDFSYMLEARPGAFVFVGNGDTANLHHPEYDFNDDLVPFGTSDWVSLVENKLAS